MRLHDAFDGPDRGDVIVCDLCGETLPYLNAQSGEVCADCLTCAECGAVTTNPEAMRDGRCLGCFDPTPADDGVDFPFVENY